MEKIFTFTTREEVPFFVHEFVKAPHETIVQRAFPLKSDQQWWDNWDFKPHELYNVSGLSPVHNAIYLGLAWRITQGLDRFGIPTWTRDDASDETGKSFDFVKWEYSTNVDGKILDQGFIPASSSPGPIDPHSDTYLDVWKYEHRNLAGLFSLESFVEFVGIQKPSLVEAFSETNYFALESNKSLEGLVAALNSNTRPELADILGANDIFIDLFVGLDMGYPDSVLIKSKRNLKPQLNMLVNEYQVSIEKFEARMADIYEMNDFTKAITELVNL